MIVDPGHLAPGRRIMLALPGTAHAGDGMHEYGKAWADLLLRRGWETGVFASNYILGAFPEKTYPLPMASHPLFGTRLYHALSLSSMLQMPPARSLAAELAAYIRSFKPDVVHFVDRTLFTAYLLEKTAKIFPRIFFIHTMHDPQWHEERISRLGGWLKCRDYCHSLRLSSRHNVFMHVHDARLVQGSMFEGMENLLEMPHPLPPVIARRSRRAINSEDSSYPVRLGFLGRIEAYKGLDVLHSAIANSLRKGRIQPWQIELVIAGEGGLDERQWRQLPCTVELRNARLSDWEFHQLMADLDLLILPYKSATQSGVGMLGLAYGIPLVASRVGALDMLVSQGETGLLVPASDSNALEDALVTLISVPRQLALMSKNVRALQAMHE